MQQTLSEREVNVQGRGSSRSIQADLIERGGFSDAEGTHTCLGSVGGTAIRLQHVITIFTTNVTHWGVVANSEWQGVGGVNVAQGVADHSGTANVGGRLPDDLTEVTPLVEVGHAGVGFTVRGGEELDFTVVHQVGDHNTDITGLNTVTDVLTVAATINGTARGKVLVSCFTMIGLVHNRVLTYRAHMYSERQGSGR